MAGFIRQSPPVRQFTAPLRGRENFVTAESHKIRKITDVYILDGNGVEISVSYVIQPQLDVVVNSLIDLTGFTIYISGT